MEHLSTIANFLVALATLLLSVYVLKSSRRQARSEYTRSLQDAWNTFNTAVLASEANIQAAGRLHKSDSTPSDMDGHQIWLSFVLLNALQSTFLGKEEKLVDQEYAEKTLTQILDPLLLDDSFFILTQKRGYHPKFVEECQARLKALKGH